MAAGLGLSMRLTEADRIIKATVILNREKPFFAYILMSFDTQQTSPDTQVPTMGVSKYGKLYWNEDFTKNLSSSELQYVLCHEALHIAKGDMFRRGSRDPQIWNIASDCIINDMINCEKELTPPKKIITIKEDGTKTEQPNGLIPDSKGDIKIGEHTYNTRNKTTEELYDEMSANAEKIKVFLKLPNGEGEGEGEGKGGSGTPGHGGFDIHIEGGKDVKGEDTGDESDGSASISAAESKWKKVAVEAATIARQRGCLPGSIESLVDGILNPVVDWRSRLRSFITNEIPVDFDTRLPGRSFYSTGVWCPRIYRENMELYISVDCSGSTMGDRERFLTEIQDICTSHNQLKARVIFWSFGEINPNNDIEVDSQTLENVAKLNLRDVNGGTEFSAYKRHLDRMGYNSRIHIVLTDGYIEHNPDVPEGTILFVLCGSSTDEIVKDYGECIHIQNESRDWA